MTRPEILLNPGPVVMSERVRRALCGPDVCHREPEFAARTLDVARRLRAVHAPGAGGEHGGDDGGDDDRYRAVLLGGSGTSAVEAMLASLVPREGGFLAVTNGVYGERMAAMVTAHGKRVRRVDGAWTDAIDLAAVDQALARDAGLTHVGVVHNETTTGRLNDLGPLAELVHARGRRLLIDAVSSFAGEELDLAAWRPAAVAGTANKCLHGAPGVSFVLVEGAQLERCEGRASTLYLDLARYRGQLETGFSPFTLPTHVMAALQEALLEFEERGGWRARRERYRALAARIRTGLAELGVETLLEPGASSSMITAYRLPAGTTYAGLHDGLKARGFVIYAGQGDLSRTLFRIANMGEIEDGDIALLLSASREVLRP